jgi:hypothetical protein
MRPATTVAVVLLLAALFIAGTIQFFLMAR